MKRNRQNIYRQLLGQTASIPSTYKEIVAGGTGYFQPRNIPGTFAIHLKSAIATELLFNNGDYERDIIRLLKALKPKPGDAVNIGANIGLISVLLASREIFPRIMAFEPNREAFALLQENVQRNGLEGNVSCHKVALSETAGEVTLNFVPDQPEFSSLSVIVHPAVSEKSQSTETVQADTLDNIVSKSGLNPSLLVIDTEGADALVLYGGQKCLQVHRPTVICECSSNLMKNMGRGVKDLEQLFAGLRYKCFDAHTLRDFEWTNPDTDTIVLAIPEEEEPAALPLLKAAV